MSRGDGRALQMAAEALPESLRAFELRRALVTEEKYGAYVEVDREQAASDVIDRYLDALLSELPEEAVEAAYRIFLGCEDAGPVVDIDFRDHILPAFLLSLRSSSRGQTDDV